MAPWDPRIFSIGVECLNPIVQKETLCLYLNISASEFLHLASYLYQYQKSS